ncbi:type 2 periplasmic-binding domain-containing protein [Amycolatopsis rifamycinica]|uniref:LysR substrate-binding domain-containing protein n=1 Tax=Amycolatopsis rifamycinica TaxID=287986 RepID=A0A066UA96_9PSEU|nr:hypothetical protein [Amycolatopsis rifamycinica]KDN24035.1 hypothetical protein DV20_01200 [Amycolatopsis rifamycinica]
MGLDSLIDLVATGQLVAVVGDSVVDRLGGHVTAVPVTGIAPHDVLLAWPSDSHDPRIANFVSLAG